MALGSLSRTLAGVEPAQIGSGTGTALSDRASASLPSIYLAREAAKERVESHLAAIKLSFFFFNFYVIVTLLNLQKDVTEGRSLDS